MEKKKLLFVCMGNICRSPSAEAVMKKVVKDQGLEDLFEIDSAGTIGYHVGEPADSRMQRHASHRGIKLTSISRKVNPMHDFEYFDYVIGMDDSNISDLYDMSTSDEARKKIYKMTDFCETKNADSVPDPYYGGAQGFELVLDLLDDACNGLLKHINNDK